jgi:hypothetical protein
MTNNDDILPFKEERILFYISIIGSSLSIICLLLTILYKIFEAM